MTRPGGFSNKTVAYWEIWNEPDGMNPVMYGGTIAQFYEMYNLTAVTLKKYDPSLRVGGPAAAHPGSSAYGINFVNFVIASKAPLDFFHGIRMANQLETWLQFHRLYLLFVLHLIVLVWQTLNNTSANGTPIQHRPPLNVTHHSRPRMWQQLSLLWQLVEFP